MQQYTLNPIARAIGKEPKAFTKADITKYILDNDIHELNFRYTAADGRLKELNFVIQDAEYLDEVLSSGERVDGSSLFPGLMEAGSSDLYVVPKFSSAFMDPFAAQPTISFFCAYMDKNGQPLAAAPDELLRRAAQAFREVTGGLEFCAMGALEYYVIRKMATKLSTSVATMRWAPSASRSTSARRLCVSSANAVARSSTATVR